jgi:hypothetical protein
MVSAVSSRCYSSLPGTAYIPYITGASYIRMTH